MNRVIILFLISVLFLALAPGYFISAQIEVPQDINEIKQKGITAGGEILKDLPQKIESLWKTEVLPIWKNLWEKGKYLYYQYMEPTVNNIFQRIKLFFGQEIMNRKLIIKEEFNKETQEIKEDIPGVSKSIWEKLLELIK